MADTGRRERAAAAPKGKRAARAKRPERVAEDEAPGPIARVRSAVIGRPWLRRVAIGVALVLLIGVGALVRIAPARSTVFSGPAGVRLFDTDSYYHLRHARYAAAHALGLQPWDPGIYPAGQPKRYAGLFDVAIGAAALVAGGGHPEDGLVARVAAWTPPVFGLMAILALLWMATRARGVGAGLVAVAIVTLFPGNFLLRSLLGAVDHHVAEVLLALLTAVGLIRSIAVAARGAEVTATALRRWRPDLLSPLPLAVFLFTWFGAPIYLVLTAVTFFAVGALVSTRDGTARPLARAAFRYGAGLLVLVGGTRLIAPGLVMEGVYFKKALFAAALFTTGVPAYLLACETAIARLAGATATPERHRRIALLVTAGSAAALVVALACVAALLPEGRRLASDLLEVKTDLVKEQAAVGIGRYALLGGAPGFLAFAALPLAVVAAWRRRAPEPPGTPTELGRVTLAFFGTLVVLLWLRTRDYGYVAPPFLAWLATDVLVRVVSWLRTPRHRIAVALVAAAIVIVPVWPAGAAAPLAPDAATIRELMILRPGWEEALAWMREATPPLALPLDAPVPPGARFRHPPGNYGVLAFWDFGHYVAELGRRPPVASGGISTSTARWFLLDDEDTAVRALAEGLRPGERVRYCIADAQTAGDFFVSGLQMAGENVNSYIQIFAPGSIPGKRLMRFNDRYARSMDARLYEGDGVDLGHFRLVYASPEENLLAYHAPLGDGAIVRKATRFFDAEERALWQRSLSAGQPVVLSDEIVYEGRIGPAVKVFEHVAGARLVGQAPPGAALEAGLDLTARASGYVFHYGRAGHADGTGQYEIVVPYPTEAVAEHSDVAARGVYQIRNTASGGADAVVGQASVSTADVEEGRVVATTAPAAATP